MSEIERAGIPAARRKPIVPRSGLDGGQRARAAVKSAAKAASIPALRAGGTRLVTLPISAALSLVTAKVVIHHYGFTAYGVFALILAVPALLPSKDLGLGAKVIDVVARRRLLGGAELERTLSGALGRVGRIACLLVVVVIALQLVGWQHVLGGAVRGIPDEAISLGLAFFLLGLPGGLSTSVLWGLRRNDLVALQAPLLTLMTCLAVLVTTLSGLPIWVAIVFAMASNCAIQWGTLYLVIKHIGLSTRVVLAGSIFPEPQSLGAWAFPMLVISTAGAIGYQADRIILSHTTGPMDVARYSVAAQLFFPLWAIVSSAGYTLWGKYAVERDGDGILRARFLKTVAAFAAVGVAEAVVLTLAGPWATQLVLGASAPRGVCAAFGLLLVLQATGLPLGMLLTDARGLQWQAALFSIMVVLNVALSIIWSQTIGAAGPILASAVAYGFAVLVPSGLLIRRYVTTRAMAWA